MRRLRADRKRKATSPPSHGGSNEGESAVGTAASDGGGAGVTLLAGGNARAPSQTEGSAVAPVASLREERYIPLVPELAPATLLPDLAAGRAPSPPVRAMGGGDLAVPTRASWGAQAAAPSPAADCAGGPWEFLELPLEDPSFLLLSGLLSVDEMFSLATAADGGGVTPSTLRRLLTTAGLCKLGTACDVGTARHALTLVYSALAATMVLRILLYRPSPRTGAVDCAYHPWCVRLRFPRIGTWSHRVRALSVALRGTLVAIAIALIWLVARHGLSALLAKKGAVMSDAIHPLPLLFTARVAFQLVSQQETGVAQWLMLMENNMVVANTATHRRTPWVGYAAVLASEVARLAHVLCIFSAPALFEHAGGRAAGGGAAEVRVSSTVRALVVPYAMFLVANFYRSFKCALFSDFTSKDCPSRDSSCGGVFQTFWRGFMRRDCAALGYYPDAASHAGRHACTGSTWLGHADHSVELLGECAPLLLIADAAVGRRAVVPGWTLGAQGALVITMCAMCAFKNICGPAAILRTAKAR